jgi:hypothetical protein
MNLSGITMNMTAEIPITIGTIPFRNTFVDFMPNAVPLPPQQPNNTFNQLAVNNLPGYSGNIGMGQPQQPSTSVIPSAPVFDMYPDLPPPSYSEAMQNDKFEYNTEQVEGSSVKNGGDIEGVGGQANLGFSNGQENGEAGSSDKTVTPSAPPPGYDYVPNYITYGYNNTKGK